MSSFKWYKDTSFMLILMGMALAVFGTVKLIIWATQEQYKQKQVTCDYIMSTAKTKGDTLNFIVNVSDCSQIWVSQFKKDSI